MKTMTTPARFFAARTRRQNVMLYRGDLLLGRIEGERFAGADRPGKSR